MKNLMEKLKKSKKSIIILFLAIGAAILALYFVRNGVSSSQEIAPRLGFYAPNFNTVYLNGSEFELYELRGKPVILNFWATWCPPCVREMPNLQDFYDRHKDEVVVIGVNLGEKNRTIQNFIKRINVTFPIVLDKDKEIEKYYNLIIRPTTYFIDEKGLIVDKKLGELKKEELEERGRKLLK
ncbi:redoxin domain-containing protein [Candidatus Woesearchaeota archaeon]|nr:redoxin domain-containing protein [Candidatus Woesearchaeota archaeon]